MALALYAASGVLGSTPRATTRWANTATKTTSKTPMKMKHRGGCDALALSSSSSLSSSRGLSARATSSAPRRGGGRRGARCLFVARMGNKNLNNNNTMNNLADEDKKRKRRGFRLGIAAVAAALIASALLLPEASLAKSKAAVASAAQQTSSSFSFSLKSILNWVLHLDHHLVELFENSGRMAYGVLFAIIFAETGFVVTPFLPGDSLLFACGALGALGVLNFPLVVGLLFTAAVLGDTVNYMCGSFFGETAIKSNPKIFKPDYIEKTRSFYKKYGGRTVVLARFFVIVRTFAPFVAGVAKMEYSKFALYNILGAGVWILSFMGLGYFFGNVPVVKENFATTIVVIVVLSLIPIVVELFHKNSSDNETTAEAS